MDVDAALRHASDEGPDGLAARRVLGAHLATEADLRFGSVVLGIGTWGLELIEGARGALEGLRRYAVHPDPRQGWAGGVDLRWITARPPGDQPLTIFTSPVLTGVNVVAVLDDLHRDGLPPVAVCTDRARRKARDHIGDHHSNITIITPTPRLALAQTEPATDPEDAS